MSIQNIVKNKIKEHQQIIEQIQVDVDKMREKLAAMKKQAVNQQQLMLESAKLLALKDRMMFHKAATMALKDIEVEITNYERREQKN
jgi:O-phosphoseryl-tRNA(Cys) synthetase